MPPRGRLLLDTRLLGTRWAEVWVFLQAADRERAERLGVRATLLRNGRHVLRVFEGRGADLDRLRREIREEERELGHALTVPLGHLPLSRMGREVGLVEVLEPGADAFQDRAAVLFGAHASDIGEKILPFSG